MRRDRREIWTKAVLSVSRFCCKAGDDSFQPASVPTRRHIAQQHNGTIF